LRRKTVNTKILSEIRNVTLVTSICNYAPSWNLNISASQLSAELESKLICSSSLDFPYASSWCSSNCAWSNWMLSRGSLKKFPTCWVNNDGERHTCCCACMAVDNDILNCSSRRWPLWWTTIWIATCRWSFANYQSVELCSNHCGAYNTLTVCIYICGSYARSSCSKWCLFRPSFWGDSIWVSYGNLASWWPDYDWPVISHWCSKKVHFSTKSDAWIRLNCDFFPWNSEIKSGPSTITRSS
jgi:hypothetical protein